MLARVWLLLFFSLCAHPLFAASYPALPPHHASAIHYLPRASTPIRQPTPDFRRLPGNAVAINNPLVHPRNG